MKKGKISIAFIVITVIMCLCCDGLLIVHYSYKNRKIHSMEDPMDIANEYMSSRYDEHWKRLKGVFSAREEIRDWEYVVGRRIENVGRTYFGKALSKNSVFIGCSTQIEGSGIEIWSGYQYLFKSISVYVSVYNEEQEYWEKKHFVLEYENGEYIVIECMYAEEFPNKAGLEEATGMTIEEIVEFAEKQQAACEDMLWEMKKSELRRNKVRLLGGMVLINGAGTWLIIRKGLKGQKKDGHITGTETAPEDGKAGKSAEDETDNL